MLSLRRTRRRLESLVESALDRVARRVEPQVRPELERGDERQLALEHVRSAWRALKSGGRTEAQVSQSLRQMINQVEAGRVGRPN